MRQRWRRSHPASDHRLVEVMLTPYGEEILQELTIAHKQELIRLAAVWQRLSDILHGLHLLQD